MALVVDEWTAKYEELDDGGGRSRAGAISHFCRKKRTFVGTILSLVVAAPFTAMILITKQATPVILAADEEHVTKHVLVVIDMQKDYDDQANQELYGRIKTPYNAPIHKVVPAINRIRRAHAWDLVMFSQDWLDVAELPASQEPFCIAGTPGADILDGLERNTTSDLFFSKNLDDVFNTDVHRADGQGKWIHGFGLRGEGKRIGAKSDRLEDVLDKLGFRPSNTALSVTGILTDMCVLKSVLHARELGFEVRVHRSAILTGNTGGPDASWTHPSPSEIEKRGTASGDWIHKIYTHGDVGVCGEAWALGYMQAAGAKLVD